MGLGRTRSMGLIGLDGLVIDVEVDISQGLPSFTIGGRPDPSCAQAPDRVRAAAANSGYAVPQRRVTVNLSPASVPKIGSGFDLAILVAVLVAEGVIPAQGAERVAHIGELGLDGSVRPVRGVLPMVLAATAAGVRHFVVPVANAREARLVTGARVYPVAEVAELVTRYRALASGLAVQAVDEPAVADEPEADPPDLADVVGQAAVRLALEIAAAGSHHLFLVGPPGAGKSMLAERLPGLLPTLDTAQALEVTAIASLAGRVARSDGLCRRPPFVAPHHGASLAAIIGGGSGTVTPGAITQAHRGVLFLDEAPEFRSHVLQALRQPMESGTVVVARAAGRFRYPCRFQLILAANPCPCGFGYGKGDRCQCSIVRRRSYAAKLAGPLLDRVDLQVHVPVPSRSALLGPPGESSAVVGVRVRAAREVAAKRWAGSDYVVNGDVPGSVLRSRRFRLGVSTTVDIDRCIDLGTLSLRGYDRCLRVAWTVADLGGRTVPTRDDVGLALSLRQHQAVAA